MIWSGLSKSFYHMKEQNEFINPNIHFLKIKYFVDGIFGFSYLPIRLITILGILISFFSFTYAFILMFMRFFFENRVEGWTTLMVVILFFCSGIQLMFTGLIENIFGVIYHRAEISMYIVEK